MEEQIAADISPIESVRRLVGQPLRLEQWNHVATRDAIRHYAWGIGDDNPLYSDIAYAERSVHGTIIAPPTFPYSVYDGVVAPGLPGYSWFYAGADWSFARAVRMDEAVVAAARLTSVRDVGNKRVTGMILQTGRTEYRTASGELLATLDAHCFRVPRRKDGKGGMPFSHRPMHQYSDEELLNIEKMSLNEFRRGDEKLSFDQVREGGLIPSIARGPLAPIDMSTYYAGAIGTAGYKSTRMRWQYRDRAINDPESLPNVLPAEYFTEGLKASMGHTDPAAAAEGGMPGAYDNGLQRIAFMVSALTNWMGDHGRLRRVGIRIKAPVIFGDTTFVHGHVLSRSETEAGHVEIELRAENQFGDVTASGTATVELPLER